MKVNYKLCWPLIGWPFCIWAIKILLTLFNSRKLTFSGYLLCTLLGAIPPALLTLRQFFLYYVKHDEDAANITSLAIGGTPDTYKSPEKRKSLYPPVPYQLHNVRPEGLILGRDNIGYICVPLDGPKHYMGIGGSGSGKSSTQIIPFLLTRKPDTAVFALDIKGELYEKTCDKNDLTNQVIAPARHDAWGYDVFYRIKSALHPDFIVVEEMRQIATSLVSMPSNAGQEAFWVNSARDMFTGLLLYYYLHGHTGFIDCVDQIMSSSVITQIKNILEADKGSEAYKMLTKFDGMDDKTVMGVFSELSNALSLFATDYDIRRMLSQTYQVTDPTALNEGKSIFLCMPEEKLSIYYNLTRLIINQVLLELTRRPEDSSPVVVIIDELARILSSGRISALLDAAATLRSRKVALFLVTQSLEALQISYSREEMLSLVNNMSYIAVLTASSRDTDQLICDRVGKYRERQESYRHDGFIIEKALSGQSSYQYKDILEPSDLADLKTKKEVVIISQDYGYFRCKKVSCYTDPQLRKLLDARWNK